MSIAVLAIGVQAIGLHHVIRLLVLRLASALFDRGVGDNDYSKDNEGNDAGENQPLAAVGGGRDPKIVFRDLTQDQSQDQRRPRPALQDHVVAHDAEYKSNDEIVEAVIGGEGADKDKQEKKRDEQPAADEGERGKLVKDEKADRGDDEIGDDQNPNHRKGHVEARLEHLGAGLETDDQQGAEKKGQAAASGDAERHRGNEIAAPGGA